VRKDACKSGTPHRHGPPGQAAFGRGELDLSYCSTIGFLSETDDRLVSQDGDGFIIKVNLENFNYISHLT
jgi:hypothetical protein